MGQLHKAPSWIDWGGIISEGGRSIRRLYKIHDIGGYSTRQFLSKVQLLVREFVRIGGCVAFRRKYQPIVPPRFAMLSITMPEIQPSDWMDISYLEVNYEQKFLYSVPCLCMGTSKLLHVPMFAQGSMFRDHG